MGIKYRIVSGKTVVRHSKSAWPYYKKRYGYELQVWTGKGSGWGKVMRSGE